MIFELRMTNGKPQEENVEVKTIDDLKAICEKYREERLVIEFWPDRASIEIYNDWRE